MKKIAVFVEGHTEFIFLQRLIEEIAGYGKVHIELAQMHANRSCLFKTAGAPIDSAELLITLTNCRGDGTVKSAILERKALLASRGYSVALGLLDLFPKTLDELDIFEEKIKIGLDDAKLQIHICIAVKEIEAWFLNECNHFTNIDPRLTAAKIEHDLKFNPEKDSAEEKVHHPATMLGKIYKLVALNYDKKENEVKRTVDAVDYENFIVTTRSLSKSLDKFLGLLESNLVS